MDVSSSEVRRQAGVSGAADAIIWHHTSVVVADIDRAVSFYRDQFGFQVSLESRLAAQIQRLLALPDITCDLVQGYSPISGHVLELIEFSNVPAGADSRLPIWPGMAHLAFVVPDLQAAMRSLAEAGGRPVGQVAEFREGPAVYCWTPAGTVVELEQWHDPHQAETRR
jgi:catechol 2,3-dioxygenase-like lactoylglutathione lyase family enzyme